MKRVVITGLGTVNPVGNDVSSTWDALINGRSGVGRITKFDAVNFNVKIAGEVKDFNPENILGKKEIRKMDLYVQYSICSADEAIKDAKLNFDNIDPYRVGVLIATGIGGIKTLEDQHSILLSRGPRKVSPFLIPMMIVNMASGQVAIKYGLKGPNFSISSACASSGHGIISAYRIIQRGEADIMLSGGAEASVTPLAIGGFSVMRALSTRNDDPKTSSRPFDKERDGFVVSEGAAVLVLESYEHAVERGAQIYAEIIGGGQTSDAYHITAPDVTGQGPASAMKFAMQEGKVEAEVIDHVNAHGTSTLYNDKIETKAIKIALGKRAQQVSVVSTKSMTGHLLGAASAIEALVVCLSMKNKITHPTANLVNPDPECDLDYVSEGARKTEINYALSNSLGFGGHNVSILFKNLNAE